MKNLKNTGKVFGSKLSSISLATLVLTLAPFSQEYDFKHICLNENQSNTNKVSMTITHKSKANLKKKISEQLSSKGIYLFHKEIENVEQKIMHDYEFFSVLKEEYNLPMQNIQEISFKVENKTQRDFYGRVDKKERMFYLYEKLSQIQNIESDKLLVKIPVALGKPSSPTPTGQFYLKRITKEPWWYPTQNMKGKTTARPGVENPFGIWMAELHTKSGSSGYGFGLEGNTIYRIHSTNNPDSIGKYASGGCVRTHPDDADILFPAILSAVGHEPPKKTSRGNAVYPLKKNIPVVIE